MFFPFGIFGGEVVDPEQLAGEYQRAARKASRTTQHQWARDAMPDRNVLLQGDHVRIHEVEVVAELYREGVKLSPVGNDPDLTRATGDPDLFHVPYNRGLVEVDDQSGNPLAVEWTSKYPEVVVVIVDYQYCREKQQHWDTQNQRIDVRTQFQIYLDNGGMAGSGPWAIPLSGGYRGTGYARRSNRSQIVAMQLVGAGAHRAVLMAGQMPADFIVAQDDEDDEAEVSYLEYPPTEGVCVGSRKIIVLRFPRGGILGA